MANLSYIRQKRHGENVTVENSKIVTEFKTIENIYGIGYKNEYQEHIVESITNIINASPNLMYAMECVGAAYCIPSTSFNANDDVVSLKVQNGNVVGPSNVSAAGNIKPIIKAIAAMLDNKSQIIDNKLDHHHMHHIHDLKKNIPQFTPDPAKGTVIGRYVDDNGGEILVYNTGIVDCNSTPEAHRKLEELRMKKLIPDYNADVLQGSANESNTANYFADMDDISQGVDMGTDNNTMSSEDVASDNGGEMNIAESINEDDNIVEAYSIFGDTVNLGYDLMTLQGFDFVKPTTQVVQEASKVSEGKKKNKEVLASDLEYMRFDNTHIINAVKKINSWVESVGVDKLEDVSFDNLYNSKNFSEAVDELSEQFDAKIHVHYNNSKRGFNVYTTISEEKAGKLKEITISKSKGFQYSGNPIDIHIEGSDTIRDISVGKIELIGQTIVSILLHEIFHNAMWVWKIRDTEFTASLALTLQLASREKSARKRRKIITNYVNLLDNFYGVKMNLVNKQILIKRMSVIAAITQKPQAPNKLKLAINKKSIEEKNKGVSEENSNIDKDVQETTSMYEKYMKREARRLSTGSVIAKMICGVAAIVGGGILAGATKNTKGADIGELVGIGVIIGGSTLTVSGILTLCEKSLVKLARDYYENEKDLEEQWCDMFAAIYKLPPTFKIMTASNKTYTDSQISKDVLYKFNKIDIEIHKLIMDEHPSGTERNYLAVKIANNLLENGDKLDPEIKSYLEWLSEAYKQTGEQDEIKDIYNKSVFSPEAADKFDEHLEHLTQIADVTLTEFTAYDVTDWNVIGE